MCKRWYGLLCVTLLFVLMAVGCSEKKQNGGQQISSGTSNPVNVDNDSEVKEIPLELDPVTLKLYTIQPISDEHFELLIASPLKSKYPHITVEKVTSSTPKITESVAAQEQIDLVTFFHGHWGEIGDLKLIADLNPIVTRNRYDLSRFDQGALNTILNLTDNGELVGLPYHMQFNALYYNKDLFDKFGEDYPRDGMTWDDTLDIVKRMTKTDNGVNYTGLTFGVWTRLTLQKGVLPVDFDTMKAAVNSSPFQEGIMLGRQIYEIQDNDAYFGTNRFVKDRTQAMHGDVADVLYTLLAEEDHSWWDLAQYPSYSDLPDTYTQYDMHAIGISSTSKHQDDALRVMEVFLSDEVAKLSTSMTGRVPPLADPQISTFYGIDNPALTDKNIAGIFKSKPNPNAAKFTKYHFESYQLSSPYMLSYFRGEKDINTAIREAEEAINQYLVSQLEQ